MSKCICLSDKKEEAIVADFAKRLLEAEGHAVPPYDASKNRPLKVLSQLMTVSDFIVGLATKAKASVEGEAAKVARIMARKDVKSVREDATAAKAKATLFRRPSASRRPRTRRRWRGGPSRRPRRLRRSRPSPPRRRKGPPSASVTIPRSAATRTRAN